ncbi:hypothetical protein Tco_0528736 [Tanacetum coccineum]
MCEDGIMKAIPFMALFPANYREIMPWASEKSYIYNVVENTCNEAKLYDLDKAGKGIVIENILFLQEMTHLAAQPNTGKQEKKRQTCGDYRKYEESHVSIKRGSISKKNKSNYSSFQDLRSSCNEDMVKYEGPRLGTTQARALNKKQQKDSTRDLPAAR